ncbi:DNA-binding protein [Mesorhizobium sp. LNJC405B00]|uniref:DNA-binding protein n=1 Tax=unclassified Mesorhizobium TaxID=325217 RepID=UPI0018DD9BC6|nr:DNA-binding protein [Mesorhizobium sp. LNJC405B00]
MTVNSEKTMALIWGAEAIARELGTNRRRAFHLLETDQIPAKKSRRTVGRRARRADGVFPKGEAA